MTLLYPIVLETEDNGTVSAYVPGLPVYAAAESPAKAERAIRAVLTAYLTAHPASRPDARVRVARFSGPALSEGIEAHRVEGVTVRVYSPAKTVANCFKYRCFGITCCFKHVPKTFEIIRMPEGRKRHKVFRHRWTRT